MVFKLLLGQKKDLLLKAEHFSFQHQEDSSWFHASGWICWMRGTDIYKVRHTGRFTTTTITASAALPVEQMSMMGTEVLDWFRLMNWQHQKFPEMKMIVTYVIVCMHVYERRQTQMHCRFKKKKERYAGSEKDRLWVALFHWDKWTGVTYCWRSLHAELTLTIF